MEKNINFIVKEDEKNLRVDVLINKREELISRTRIKNLILKEKLTLNNEIIKSPSKKLHIACSNPNCPQKETSNFKILVACSERSLCTSHTAKRTQSSFKSIYRHGSASVPRIPFAKSSIDHWYSNPSRRISPR